MRLQEYGRNPNKRKAYVYQHDLLLVGVDVSKAKHNACLGTQTTVSCRKLEFTHTREGFRRFDQTLQDHLSKNRCQRLLIAMEPSGIYGQALYERLKGCGYGICLVHCQAVRNNRKTMQDGISGGSTVNRGHAHHRSIRCCSTREGRPRRFGGAQRDSGT